MLLLDDSNILEDEHIAHLAPLVATLTQLRLSSYHTGELSPVGLAHMAALTALQSLQLRYVAATDAGDRWHNPSATQQSQRV